MNRPITALCLTLFLTLSPLMAETTDRYTLVYQGFPYRKTTCQNPTYAQGEQIRLATISLQKDNFIFRGWKYDGQTYEPGALFTMPADNVELLPVWSGLTTDQEQENAHRPIKVIRDGQLLIICNDTNTIYNAQGVRIQ